MQLTQRITHTTPAHTPTLARRTLSVDDELHSTRLPIGRSFVVHPLEAVAMAAELAILALNLAVEGAVVAHRPENAQQTNGAKGVVGKRMVHA